jgi:hypothetical protein
MKFIYLILTTLNIISSSKVCNILSFSGGGSYGAIEVGILSKIKLSEYNLITGISAGALNAGLLSYFNSPLKFNQGIQELTLLSDTIEIQGLNFYKSFFILNSSDKSRRLSFNAGLFCESKNFYVVPSMKNVGLTKKHLRGVSEAAEIASEGLDGESFNEQIESLNSLVNHRISLSNLRNIIVTNKDVKADHQKFDAFKNAIIFYSSEGRLKLTGSQYNTLRTYSESLTIDNDNDFYLDAFWSFQVYMRLFNKQDAHIVKRETQKIMSMTQWSVRNQTLEALGII